VTDANALADTEHPAAKPQPRRTSETFCIRPWQHMRLEASGESRVCCAYQAPPISQDGVPLSTDRHSLMEIWNSNEMRGVRRDMIEGRRVAGCVTCYTDEARGAVSLRMRDNQAWQQGWLNEQRATFDDMATLAIDNDYRLPELPVMMEVETGNLCNLKCRMCNSFNSSQIAADPVQRTWEGPPHAPYIDADFQRGPRKLRRVGAIEALVDELAKDTASRIRRLYFLGGEPFLVRELPRLLERLVAVGRAPQISLLFVSNGSVVPEWLSLAAEFGRVDLSISVDGCGDDYDYIRYPGRWSDLTHNIQLFKQFPNLGLRATTTIQVNNVLRLTSLFRWLDAAGIGFTGYLLHYPSFLAVNALPASIRRLAAARLLDYAKADCPPDHRALVESFATQFEAGDESGDPVLLRDFMLFTNDLDATRGQSIHQTDPELVALLEQAGFPWLDATLHAPADATPQDRHRRRPAPMKTGNASMTLQRDLGVTVISLRDELSQARDRLGMLEEQARLREEEVRIRDEQARRREDEVRLELARVCLAFDQTRLAFDQIRRELAQVHASRSWRLTRPVRAAGRLLRRWTHGAGSHGNPDGR